MNKNYECSLEEIIKEQATDVLDPAEYYYCANLDTLKECVRLDLLNKPHHRVYMKKDIKLSDDFINDWNKLRNKKL